MEIEARVRIIARRYIHVKGKRLKLKLYTVAGVTLDQRCFLAFMSYDGIVTSKSP